MYKVYETSYAPLNGNEDEIKEQIIRLLVENQYSISSTRALFSDIIERFEVHMPVTADKR